VLADSTASNPSVASGYWVQVEIVMGLEEAFGITVDESSAQEIKTVEDAATLIDKLVNRDRQGRLK
jgi:uncharacterized protein (DUF697 family)